MKFEAFAGTGKVFRFTLAQLLKSKANRKALIVVLVMALLSVPLLSLIRGGGASGGNSLSVIHIDNQSGISLKGLPDYLKTEGFEDVTIENGLPEDPEDEAALRIINGTDGLKVEIAGNVNKSYYAAELTAAYLRRQMLLDAGFTAEQADQLVPAGTDMVFASELDKAPVPQGPGDGGEEPDTNEPDDSEGGLSGAYSVQLGFSVLLIMVSMISVNFVIRSVVEEKTSKLVDLLLVSVKPGALLLGKVLASLVYSLIYFAVMLCGAFLSRTICGLFMDLSGFDNYMTNILKLDLAPDVLLVLLVSSLFGLLVFGILAGLCGAGCSSVEESGGAMGLCLFLIMGGYMVSLMTMAMGVPQGNVAKAFSIIPVLSMFAAPTLYMYDAVGIGTVALGWLVHLVLVILLMLLAGKVYSSLIIYKGKRLSFGRILRLALGKEVSK